MYRRMTCKLKWILLFYPFASSAQNINSQKTPQEHAEQKTISNSVLPKSSLTSTIDIPDLKSLSTLDKSGDANIAIPVVNVKGRKLTLPISLSYNTNGIKVQQSASEVGLGWNINFGSIIRDYGAYEPDYTYTGSEFKMLYWGNTTGVPTSTDEQINPSGYDVINPIEHGTIFKYNGVESGMAPDEYIINVPGLQSNSFWNYNATGSSTSPVNFVFTENVPWKISQEAADFSFPQEMSRINELDYMPIPNTSPVVLDNSHNFAAALGFYPYVKNYSFPKYIGFYNNPVIQGPIEVGTVTYNDYSKFTITTNDGTKYVFGKPLRGQKYLISDAPFWSTMNTNQFTQSGNTGMANSFRKSYGEFWKTDYIAEWLLTEVRSADYVDLNGNGPDAADGGDWIKIEYTQNYKQWLNFTQTDKASSLFREKAYVSSITTPIQQINFSTEPRNDIDMDHFASVFNRVNLDYVYNNARINVYGTNIYLNAKHPIEERIYKTAEVKQITDGTTTVQNISFNYAVPGSQQELAKSVYYIMDRNSNYNVYNPEDLGSGLDSSHFFHGSSGGDALSYPKGKTTLLGLTITGANTSSANKIDYKFSYENNVSYDQVAIFKILQMGTFPTIRQSHKSTSERWGGTYPQIMYPNKPRAIAHSMLPWKWLQVKSDKSISYGTNTSRAYLSGQELEYSHLTIEDEFGYRSNLDLTTGEYQFNRNAWVLSEVKLPYGGSVKYIYENDRCDIVNDRNNWPGIADYALPSVAHFNNLAHMRSIKQSAINLNWKEIYREYYFTMNEQSGGLRVSNIEFKDPYNNNSIVKNYSYGTGHFTAPPAEYYQNYMQGYSSFMHTELLRHIDGEAYHSRYDNLLPIPYKYSDFAANMSRLVVSNKIDNSLRKAAQHFYESVAETSSDGAIIKSYYGRLLPLSGGVMTDVQRRLPFYDVTNYAIKGELNDRHDYVEVLALNINSQNPPISIGNYKTEMLDKYGNVVEELRNEYEYIDHNLNNNISTKEQLLLTKNYLVFTTRFSSLLSEESGLVFDPGYPSFNRMYDGSNIISSLDLTTSVKTIGGSLQNAIHSKTETKGMFSVIGFSCAFYSNQPSWLTSVSSTTQKWQSLGISATQMRSNLQNGVNAYSQLTSAATHNLLPINRENGLQEEYYTPAGSFINLKSITLRPKSSITVKKF